MSEATTQGIRVVAEPNYEPDRSQPDANYFFFSYRIEITNLGDVPAQLVSRRWVITDGSGRVDQVDGPGVIGHQPRLQPGETFDYTSFCPLRTPVGTMQGTYQMVRDDGSTFEATIAPFTLAAPNSLN